MKKNLIVKSFIIAGSVMSSAVFAADAVSAQAEAAFTSLTTQATEMSGYAWTLAVLIVGATVGIKLFKKFVNRAS